MSRRRETVVKVDIERFKKALNEKGLTLAEISMWKGKSRAWLSIILSNKDGVPVSVVDMLEKFGIPRDRYSLENQPEDNINPISTDVNTELLEAIKKIVHEEVRKQIKLASKDGIKMALGDHVIRGRIKQLIYEALEDVLPEKKDSLRSQIPYKEHITPIENIQEKLF